jgi:methylmalonyl-CoA mutase, C-terminal domain
MSEQKIKILLSKLGLDVHNRGIITVSKLLRDAGMEVIYIGNVLPEAIISTAVQEAVDIVGVSSLGGAHLKLGRDLIEQAKEKGLHDQMSFIIGGIFPDKDAIRLKEIGFDDVFTSGATREEIISSVHGIIQRNRKKID